MAKLRIKKFNLKVFYFSWNFQTQTLIFHANFQDFFFKLFIAQFKLSCQYLGYVHSF